MTTTGATSPTTKKPRIDGQITGLAGELFVAAELLKRGLQTSVTFGNAKSVDLLAYDSHSKRKCGIAPWSTGHATACAARVCVWKTMSICRLVNRRQVERPGPAWAQLRSRS